MAHATIQTSTSLKQNKGELNRSHQSLTSSNTYIYLRVKIDGLPIPKGKISKGSEKKTLCRDCAIYFSSTVPSHAMFHIVLGYKEGCHSHHSNKSSW